MLHTSYEEFDMGVSGGNTYDLGLPLQIIALLVSNHPSCTFCGSTRPLKSFTTQYHMTSCFYTANWDHFYASWVGNLSTLAWAPARWGRALNVDHFPVKWHRDESGLYAGNTGIKHMRKHILCSWSGHVGEQRSKHKECFDKENITDVYHYK